MPDPSPIDASMKALLRRVPEAIVRLVGVHPLPVRITFEDTAINVPEHRADNVIILDSPGSDARGALYFEYQLRPDPEKIPGWELKKCGLRVQLGMTVVLAVVYLEKGDRATFPDSQADVVAGVTNEFHFTAVRLWEHADRIRKGDLWELAPLLVLCEDNPGEETIRTELELIRGSGADEPTQAHLLAVALRVGARRLPRAILEAIFRETLPMVQGASIIDDWIAEGEARGRAEGEARGRTEGEARGRTEGEAHGREEEARRLLLSFLQARFGELPAGLIERIQVASVEWSEALLLQAARSESLAELRW